MWSRSPALKNTTKCVVLHSLVYNNYKIIIITIIIIRIISPSKSVIVSFLVTNATDRLWSLVLKTLIIFLFSSYKKTCNFLYMKNYETYDFTNILHVIQVLLRLGPENHYFLSIHSHSKRPTGLTVRFGNLGSLLQWYFDTERCVCLNSLCMYCGGQPKEV